MDLFIPLDRASKTSLQAQLYTGWREAILNGRIRTGTRVPSSRELAANLGVSRTTVTGCYEQLIAEGYLVARGGSGTHVCSELPESASQVRGLRPVQGIEPGPVTLSEFGSRVQAPIEPRAAETQLRFRFNRWRPDLDSFPMQLWSRLVARHCRRALHAMFDYAEDPLGHPALRAAISDYVRRVRAVDCDADRVLIVNGSQQALDLAARLLINRGDLVAVEDPGYLGARRVFEAHGAELAGVPVDEGGVMVDRILLRTQLIYVTPSHQFPTGATLSLQRRVMLLKLAHRAGTVVIEDDYDSEYRYAGRPVPSLQGMGLGAPVIYIGTFSKVLFPGLRIGYMVLPTELVGAFSRAKQLADRQCPMLEQFVLAEFLSGGHLERHIRRMRTLYGARRSALIDNLCAHFGSRVQVFGDAAGMHLHFRLRTKLTEQQVVTRAAAAGVGIAGASAYYMDRKDRGEFLAGFAEQGERTILEGVRRLAAALD